MNPSNCTNPRVDASPADSARKTSLVAGALHVITFAGSIPAPFLSSG
jgi:hypothetical protein